jgi:hypothetical protein
VTRDTDPGVCGRSRAVLGPFSGMWARGHGIPWRTPVALARRARVGPVALARVGTVARASTGFLVTLTISWVEGSTLSCAMQPFTCRMQRLAKPTAPLGGPVHAITKG